MSRPQKTPLRKLELEEADELQRISRSESLPSDLVTRARMILELAKGNGYKETAFLVGRRSRVSISRIAARFNQEGLQALQARHGGGAKTRYTSEHREKIVKILNSKPDREKDGTAVWSITTLKRRLESISGFEGISVGTIYAVLYESGLSWQKSRSWCETGVVNRKRKAGVVQVVDVDSETKKR